MRIVSLTKEAKDNILEDLLKRSPNNYDQYQETVNEILNEVKTKGDEAVFAYTEKFDHAKLTADTFSASSLLVVTRIADASSSCSA
jgi:histidinol dehydrogenase